MLLWQHLSLGEKWLPDNKLRCNLICSSRSKCKPPMCVCFAGVSVVTRAGLGTKFGLGNHRTDRRRGGVIAIVEGGGAAVNKELRREVREISPRRPFLPTTDGGGPAQKCASAPRALPGTPDGQSSPGCDCRGGGGGGVLSNWWCSLVGRRCSET